MVETKVLDYTFDIGLVGHEIRDKRLIGTEFLRDELVAIVSAEHSWASRRRKISPGEFLHEPFITTTAGSGTRSLVEDRLRQNGVTLSRVLDFGNTEGVTKAVGAGLGVSILSKRVVQRELAAGLLRNLPLAGTNMIKTM